jgi:hypothetical protein
MIRKSIFVLILTSIVACSGPDRKSQAEPFEVFATHILDNGTKLFVFSLEMTQDGGPQGEKSQGGGGPGGGGGQGGPPQGQGSKGGNSSKGGGQEKQLDEKLIATLEQTKYCREGYVVLDRNVVEGISSIRGECNDGATEQDRASFIDG